MARAPGENAAKSKQFPQIHMIPNERVLLEYALAALKVPARSADGLEVRRAFSNH